MPPLPSPRPQTGQILDSWRHKRRQEALALCAPGLPGIPKKWTDAATNKHGYLLDLIRLRTGGASLHRAMEEALPFFSLPPSTSANGAPLRACSALSSTPNVRQSRPRRPAQSALACPRPGRAFWRARLRRHLAYRRRHRNRAICGHPCPRHSCRGGSIGRQPLRLQTTTRPLPVGHRRRKRCGRQLCREPSLAPLC